MPQKKNALKMIYFKFLLFKITNKLITQKKTTEITREPAIDETILNTKHNSANCNNSALRLH